jgi:hypothetical protein
MYDAGKIIIGLVIFVVFFTFAFRMNGGKAIPAPEPKLDTPAIKKLPKAERKCVESKEFMRTEHMQLLDRWRDEALREGNTEYINKNGKMYIVSLQNTCMKCHSNKKDFCDKCHDYAGVKPYCWRCHFVKGQMKDWWSKSKGKAL